MALNFQEIVFSREEYSDYQEEVGRFLSGESLISLDNEGGVDMTPEIQSLLELECPHGIPQDDDGEPWRVSDIVRNPNGKVYAKLEASHNLAIDKDYIFDAAIEVAPESVQGLIRLVDPDGMDAVTERICMEAAARRAAGEEEDPLLAMEKAILQGEEIVPLEDRRVILKAHCGGPWKIDTLQKKEIFEKWLKRAGSPLNVSQEISIVHGEKVYEGDRGDCVLAESAKGNKWAIWTRPEKGRIQVGFKDDEMALKFRAVCQERWSQEATNNKRPALVVLEGFGGAFQRAAEVERIALVLRAMRVMMTR